MKKGEDEKTTTCLLLILPVAAMIAVTIIGMYITGGGNILNGAGMRSFLWGVLSGIAIAFVMILGKKVMTFKEASSALYEGWVGMLPIIIILPLLLVWATWYRPWEQANTWQMPSPAF